MTRILVTGAYGLLGSSLCPRLLACGHDVIRHGRDSNSRCSFDLADSAAVATCLNKIQPDVIVNLVAATSVDECEHNPQIAYFGNVRTVEGLAEALRVRVPPPHLVHLSSDQVYDGLGPHEEHIVAPCNVYGLSKLAGEFVAARVGATVLRTNFFGRSRCAGRISLSDWIVNSLRAGQRITVFDDVLFSALHINTLCDAIVLAIQKRHPGTFNVGCSDGSSKAHLAYGLADRLGFDRNLMTVGSAKDVKLRARRPLDMRMDSASFEHIFGFAAPTFESQIDLAAQEYQHEQAIP